MKFNFEIFINDIVDKINKAAAIALSMEYFEIDLIKTNDKILQFSLKQFTTVCHRLTSVFSNDFSVFCMH